MLYKYHVHVIVYANKDDDYYYYYYYKSPCSKFSEKLCYEKFELMKRIFESVYENIC